MRNRKGFTLAELLCVVGIIAVLVAVAIPVFTASTEKARASVCLSNRRAFYGELVTTYVSAGELTAENTPDVSGCVCPSGGTISYAQQGDEFAVSCSVHEQVIGSLTDLTGASTQAKSFTEFLEQWLKTPDNSLKDKGRLYAEYYAGHHAVPMTDEFKETLNAAPGFNNTLKDDTFYWWSYPVTDANGDVLYTVTYANGRSNPADWTSGSRGSIGGGYVVIVNGKTYYRGNTGSTVEPGNVYSKYTTENALEQELIKRGYIELK